MGKRTIATGFVASICMVVIFAMCTLVFGWNSSPPRANIYGFDNEVYGQYFRDSYSTVHNSYARFSGIETWWDTTPGGWTDPSTHKALCNRGWQSWYHLNETAGFAHSQMNGDAVFVHFNHANRHVLDFGKSNLIDTRAWTVPGETNYYLEDLNDLNDMKFALFLGCDTSQGENDNITWYTRCVKKVDTVIGFDQHVTYYALRYINGGWRDLYPMHVWNECFWTYACQYGYNIGQSEGLADGMVANHCNGNYFGLNTSETWGNPNAKLTAPGNGVIE